MAAVFRRRRNDGAFESGIAIHRLDRTAILLEQIGAEDTPVEQLALAAFHSPPNLVHGEVLISLDAHIHNLVPHAWRDEVVNLNRIAQFRWDFDQFGFDDSVKVAFLLHVSTDSGLSFFYQILVDGALFEYGGQFAQL